MQAVQKHLPWKGQADIVAELRGNLEAQLEDKEGELGRDLTSAEAEAWLKQLGSPQKMAARYQPQQYLIGPTLFPTYKIVLRLVLTLTLFIYSIVSVVAIFGVAAEPSVGSVVESIVKAPFSLLNSAIWVTAFFALFEILSTRIPMLSKYKNTETSDWEPSKLSTLDTAIADGGKPRSFSQAMAEVIFFYVFLIWMVLVPKYPYLVFGPGVYFLHLDRAMWSPALVTIYWCIVGLFVAQGVWNTLQLIRGHWQRSMRIEKLVFALLGLVPLAMALRVPEHAYVLLRNPAVDQAQYGALVALSNVWFYRSALLICGLTLLQLLWGVGELVLAYYRRRSAAMV